MSDNPLVSIIIPTYNYGKYIRKALTSCLNQTYRNIEIIVIDDGSRDDTGEIVTSFTDPRIIYRLQKNQGVSVARNKGLDAAAGEFITFLDADDYLMADSVKIRVDALQSYTEIGFVFTSAYSSDGTGNITYKDKKSESRFSDKFWEDLLLRRLDFQACYVMMRADLARSARFPVSLSNGEDIVYFCRIFFSALGYYIPKPTAVIVHHMDSLRHDVREIIDQNLAFVDEILDDPFYGGALEYLRKELTASRYLDLFRRFYLSGEKPLARQHYLLALRAKPSCIFRTRFLSKAIKSFF
jgi:glycosyltransferase involved in cell wall biosynthesis